MWLTYKTSFFSTFVKHCIFLPMLYTAISTINECLSIDSFILVKMIQVRKLKWLVDSQVFSSYVSKSGGTLEHGITTHQIRQPHLWPFGSMHGSVVTPLVIFADGHQGQDDKWQGKSNLKSFWGCWMGQDLAGGDLRAVLWRKFNLSQRD